MARTHTTSCAPPRARCSRFVRRRYRPVEKRMQAVSPRIPSESDDRPLGLASAEAARRLASIGPNALPEQPPEPLWRRFLRQFASPLIYILLFALAFDLLIWLNEGARTWPIEAIAISVILLLNAALGLYQERRSEAALAKLKALAGVQAWVLRDGEFVRVPAESLVPGDRVRLEAGDRIQADGTLAE